jgi:L-2-hydroxyglutarate oxidase LhgO
MISAALCSNPRMERIDTLVIGAGVVGLAVARALAQAGREVIVAEAEAAIGQGISSRNSEVIHAGLYYPPGSLKAGLCVRGRELLYAYAAERGIAHLACGKLIVATEPAQHAGLAQIEARALQLGVPLQRLSADEAQALEPALHCTAALLSPRTGIVDSHGLMGALQGDLQAAGGWVALGSRVLDIDLSHAGEPVVRVQADGAQSELAARLVVNAAGLHACQLARRCHGLDPRHVPKPHYAKGNYFGLSGRAPFSRLVYPLPSAAGLGVHLTLDLGGQAKFGPDVQWLDVQDPEQIDYAVDPARADSMVAEVRRYWPALPDGALSPSYSGVRPKIVGPEEAACDFRIDGPELHCIEGLVNLFGIESPGLTASLAIGEWIAARWGRPGTRAH